MKPPIALALAILLGLSSDAIFHRGERPAEYISIPLENCAEVALINVGDGDRRVIWSLARDGATTGVVEIRTGKES